MYRIHFSSKGISVVEVMISLAVFSTISMAGYQVFFQTNDILQRKALEQKALLLAQEGVEAGYAIGRNDFEDLEEGTWGLSTTSGTWQLSGSSDTIDIFEREVVVDEINSDRKEIASNVTWTYKDSGIQTKSFSLEVTDWEKEVVSEENDDLIVTTAFADINNRTLRRIYLSTFSPTIIIDKIQISWTKNNRELRRIRSQGNIFNGTANSGDIVDIDNISIGFFAREIRFVFNQNMNNSDFTITFIMDDGSTKTVDVIDAP